MLKKSDFIRALGHGSFGSAFLVTEIASGRQLIWKRMTIVSKEDRRMALSEAEILKKEQKRILSLILGSFEDEGQFYILMEYCDKGDLRQYINRLRKLGAVINEDV
ncbi:MAG: hypothetical protein EZS28_020371 [Streblomastix strix]|uniref:non-specific serine/threonine protein kinase n=1 Tax=Streblomastix strix TaxID=222440 RepID=A0A5J4VPB7_9EUKA|nr:MAG: hypothetical protein EZS28_020371 [Streblomastix strix]